MSFVSFFFKKELSVENFTFQTRHGRDLYLFTIKAERGGGSFQKLCVERNRMLPGPPIEILRYQKTSYLIRCLIIEYSLYKQREQDSVRSCSLHSQSDAVDRGFCASLQEVRGPSQWGHQLPLVLPGR